MRGRRVLEVDAVEIGGLLRLSDAGAARVAATTTRPERFSVASLRGRRIELVSMETGRVDFEDGSFDLAIVSDLGRARTANPRFLDDLRRILGDDGAALFALPAGHPGIEQLAHELRSRFEELRFFRQVPFFGVTLVDDGADPDTASVSLDASLAGPPSEASHLVLLAGRLDPPPDERTLVELPLAEFVALTGGQETDRRREVEFLRVELRQLKGELERKDRSLKDISLRLKPLRAAIETRVHELDEEREKLRQVRSSFPPAVAETIIEKAPPPAVEVEAARAALEATEEELQKKLAEIEVLADKLQVRDADVASLETEVSRLRTRLATPSGGQDLAAARRVIQRLEQTAGEQEQRIHELERTLEDQARLQHHVGSDYRDAEARISYLKSRLEGAALERAAELMDLTARLGALTQALGQSDEDRELLKERVSALEVDLHEARARADRAEGEVERFSRRAKGELESARQQARETDGLRDEARRLAQENALLERQLTDQARFIEELREQTASLSAQKTMVELAAAQASQDVDALRRRVQELRNDRDTLAATSELLLDERDEARKVARRSLGVEQEAIELGRARDTLTEALRRAIAERDESLESHALLRAELADSKEERGQLLAQLEEAKARAIAAEDRAEQAKQRVQGLDQRLAEVQTAARTEADKTASNGREREALHEALREAAMESRQVKLEIEGHRARMESLAEAAHAAEQALGEALAQKARAEAELITLSARLSETDAQRVRSVAQAAVLKDRLAKLAVESDRRVAEAEQSKRGLHEAAELTTRIAALEEELQAKTREEEALRAGLEAARAEAQSGSVALSKKLAEMEQERRSAGEVIRFVEESVGRLAKKEEAIEVFRAWAELAARHIRALEGALQKAKLAAAAPSDFEAEARSLALSDENERLELALNQAEEGRRRLALERRARDDEMLVSEVVLASLREREAEVSGRARQLEAALVEAREQRALDAEHIRTLEAQLAKSGLQIERLQLGRASAHDAAYVAAKLRESLEASLFSRVSELELRLASRGADFERRLAVVSQGAFELESELGRVRSTLEAERQRADASLAAAETEHAALRAQLEARGPSSEDAMAQLALAEGQRRLAEDRAGEAEAKLERLESRAVSAESKVTELEAKAIRAEERADRAEKASSGLEAAARQAEEAARGSKVEAEGFRAELDKRVQEVRDTKTRLSEIEVRARELELKVKGLEEDLSRADARAKKAEHRATDTSQSVVESVRRIAELETALSEAQRRPRSEPAAAPVAAAPTDAGGDTGGRSVEALEQALKQRQAEAERLRSAAIRTASELDQARAETGRRLVDLSAKESALEQKERENAALSEHLEVLKAKLARQGDADVLSAQLREREQEIARYVAQKAAQHAEIERLRGMLQRAEESQVQLELKAAEMETQVAENQRKLELLQRDVAEKAERLRRINDLGE